MNGGGVMSFAGVVATCTRRPGLLLRELVWRWIYGIPALAILALACLHIYSQTAGALHAAGVANISPGNPWQSAAIVAMVVQILRPFIQSIALWLLPLLGLGWAIASGIGRNIVFRSYQPGLPWQPVALSCVQGIRIILLAIMAGLWWHCVRWSAAVTATGGAPDLAAYFALVAVFTLVFLLIGSAFNWVFFVTPLFLLVEKRSLGASLLRSFRPSAVAGRLLGINLAIAFARLGLALAAMCFSALPFVIFPASQSAWLYLWAAVVTVLYMVGSGFLQVVRLAALIEFWKPVRTAQIEAPQYAA